MASNKTQKENRRLLDTQRRQAAGEYSEALAPVRTGLMGAIPQSNDLRNQIRGQYTDISNRNFLPPGLTPNAQGWFNLPDVGGGGGAGGAGAYDTGDIEAGYRKLADTGGDFGEALGAARGINIGNVQAIRDRAGSVIPGFYNQFRNQMARRANVQGGYAPGFDAQTAESLRQAGREGFGASRAVEGDIADRTLAMTQAKSGALSDIYKAMQAGKLAGLGGLENIAGTRASLAESAAGRGDAGAARNLEAQLRLAGMYQEGGARGALEGAGGLSNLYRSAPGDVGMYLDAWGNLLGGKTGAASQNLANRASIQDRSWLDIIPGIIGAGAGAATGLGGLGWRPFGPR